MEPIINDKYVVADKERIQNIFSSITCVSEDWNIFTPIDATNAFMWTDENRYKPRSEWTEDDKEFLLPDRNVLFSKQDFIGWHEYAGYWGLFKPSLNEVIAQIYDFWISIGQPKIYLRTQCYPSRHINACYNPVRDQHHGRTEIWWLKSYCKGIRS